MPIFPSQLRLSHFLEGLAGALTSLCFPAGCRLCDQLLTDARRSPICDNCFSLFQEIPPGSCDICGQPGTFDPEFPKSVSYCPDCEKHRFAFQIARSFGVYEGTLARAILLLKHERIEPLGNWFAERLAGVIGKETSGWPRMPSCRSGPTPPAKKPRAGIQPGRSYWAAFGQASRSAVPASSADAFPAAAGKNGGRRYVALLLCAEAVGLTIYESCC